MKKYLMGIMTLAVAVCAFAFKKSEPAQPALQPSSYYFKYTLAHGSEGTITNWTEITQAEYDGSGCPSGSEKGCRLRATQKDATNTRPMAVYLDGNGVPTTGTYVDQVKNTEE